MTLPPQEVSQLLASWRNGDHDALDKLMPLVYDELRRIASRYMKRLVVSEQKGEELLALDEALTKR